MKTVSFSPDKNLFNKQIIMAAEENIWLVMVGWNEHEKNLKIFGQLTM
jgi:hypothetical protein